MIHRRAFLGIICAPAIVRISSIMPVKAFPLNIEEIDLNEIVLATMRYGGWQYLSSYYLSSTWPIIQSSRSSLSNK